MRFGLFLGVSLSAAARSAAALVYDKLTPNCHLLNVIWKKADINYGAAISYDTFFQIIKRAFVDTVISVSYKRPLLY